MRGMMGKLGAASIVALVACTSTVVDVKDGGTGDGSTNDGPATSDACAVPCGSSCCAGGETCLGAACCASSRVCGTSCCASGTTCYDDGAGNKKCVKYCTLSSECPPDATGTTCCSALDTSGKCSNTGTTWACVPYGVQCSGKQICRCAVGSDCQSGSCAPHVDPNTQQPIGPYVCKNNDGGLYNGCNGLTTCSGNTCCVKDTNGNNFCANPCTNDSQCGAAHCNTYNFSGSTCSGPTACGP